MRHRRPIDDLFIHLSLSWRRDALDLYTGIWPCNVDWLPMLAWNRNRFGHAAGQSSLPFESWEFMLMIQKPLIAVQTVLDISQVPVGTSIIIFVQT
jgi:hypothetical protein